MKTTIIIVIVKTSIIGGIEVPKFFRVINQRILWMTHNHLKPMWF